VRYVPLAPFYDELTRDVPYGSFADFYEEIFKKYSKKPEMILDLACGTGTLTCILAQRGYEMIGTDSSEEMLSQAMEKAYELENAITPMFLNQSMEELDLYGTVSAAVCSLDGINYVPSDALPNIFHRLKLFIEPGGLFIFDINTPEKLKGQDGEMYIDETDDVYCVWRAEFSEDDNACVYGMDLFLRHGEVWVRRQEEHVEYAHTVELLTKYLENAGFGEISVFGELKLTEPEEHENRIFIAAKRLED
jgi:ubiquinone/menaquinone biosynthesis C-methylase UbiE